MQRFTLLHDGSNQGWQAAYLAFHVSSRLGASLLVLLADSIPDDGLTAQRTTQVEVGGRAAGVTIRSHVVTDFSLDVVVENTAGSNGLFVPRQLIQDAKRAEHFLETISCPLWIVSKESEVREMAVLVSNMAVGRDLIDYATTLSHRLQESLFALVREDELALTRDFDAPFPWHSLPYFSPAEIAAFLNQSGTNLLFLHATDISLALELSVNCVVHPA